MKQFNVLWWSDTPTCSTGFAQVAKNILKIIYKTGKYKIRVLGINHTGDSYDHEKYPYDIDPATSFLQQQFDLHGRERLKMLLKNMPVDFLFIIQDTFLVSPLMKDILDIREELPSDRQFIIIYYFPIDATPNPEWVENGPCKTDFPVVYTKYGLQECENVTNKKLNFDVIYHGTDKKTFFPMDEESASTFRKNTFNENADNFIIMNVNRNQQRKDIHRSFAAYALFKKKHPDSYYFILAQMDDIGGNLKTIASQYGLEFGKDWICPAPNQYSAAIGYPIEVVNMFYNSCDLVISSTLGEGWGLSSTEAMATKRPVLFPDNTSLREIIGENEERGYLCKSGSDENLYVCLGKVDNDLIRPTVDVFDMADRMSYIYEHYDEAKTKAEIAYKWVPSWESLSAKWLDVFNRAESKLNEIRK